MSTEKRQRITFDVDADVLPHILPKGRGERRQYLNDAIRAKEHPPFSFVMPRSAEEASAEPLIRAATSELIFVGGSLLTLARQWQHLLIERVGEHVSLTFVMIDPNISENDAVYQTLIDQLGEREYVESFRDNLKESYQILRDIRAEGLSKSSMVRIVTCRETPMCGLVITDPYSRSSKMRLILHSSWRLWRLHPFMDIDPQSRDGGLMYTELLNYYNELIRRRTDQRTNQDSTVYS